MKFINLFIASMMWLFPFMGRAADAPQWSCDIYAYQYDMSIYIVIEDQDEIANEGKEVAMPVTTFGAIQQSCLDAFDYYVRRQKPEITLCSYAEFLSLLLSFYKYYDGMYNRNIGI